MVDSWIYETAEKQSFSSADDVLAAIGYGELKTKPIIDKLVHRYLQTVPSEQVVRTPIEKKPKSESGVLIDGEDGMQTHLCKCCNPLPGDQIVGYVTRGRGINIHRSDCENVATLERERMIKAEWSGVAAGKFSASLTIYATDTTAINRLTELFISMGVSMSQINAAVDKNKNVKIDVTVELSDREELTAVKNKILQIKTVTDVTRV